MKNKIQKSAYAINCRAILEKEEMKYPTERILNLLKASVDAFSKYIPSVALLKRKLEGEFDEAHALQRFIIAQDKQVDGYADALEQVRNGKKTPRILRLRVFSYYMRLLSKHILDRKDECTEAEHWSFLVDSTEASHDLSYTIVLANGEDRTVDRWPCVTSKMWVSGL